MKRVQMKNALLVILAVVLLVTLSACANTPAATGGAQSETARDIGKGNTAFSFEVTDANETVSAFNVHTDEKTVGAALLEAGLIAGETSDFGLYVKEVNGIKADYDADKAYWAFFVDGEYAAAGVDATDIESGKTYAFVYTKD